MAGGIQKYSSAASAASRAAEKKHRRIVREELSRYPRVQIKKSMTIEDLAHGKMPYSYCENGKSQRWFADGGWIFIDGKLAGAAECKYQKNRPNVCERVFKYLTVDEIRVDPRRLLVSFYGEGFQKKDGGGGTGPTIDMARHAGVIALENPSDAEFRDTVTQWIEALLNERKGVK